MNEVFRTLRLALVLAAICLYGIPFAMWVATLIAGGRCHFSWGVP